MPRRAGPPKLYPKKRSDGRTVWYIRDGGQRISTGCDESDVEGASTALAQHIARTAKPQFGDGDPHRVRVAAVIMLYATERAPHVARPHEVGRRLAAIEDFFGGMTVKEINPSTCKAYVRSRGKDSAARRELEDLQAAINYAVKNGKLAYSVPVELPEKAPPRERWLTRSEAARLIAAARGWRFDECGRMIDRKGPRNPHVARFILLGLYTGTRHEALLSIGFRSHVGGGWVDMENGVFYRRAARTRETNKKRPPAPLPDRLAAHLRRWAAMPAAGLYVISYDGGRLDRMKRAFNNTRDRAGLDHSVTPHTLRHTAVTWLLQEGETAFDVGGYVGMNAALVHKVYGHHSPEHMRRTANAFGHRKQHRSGGRHAARA